MLPCGSLGPKSFFSFSLIPHKPADKKISFLFLCLSSPPPREARIKNRFFFDRLRRSLCPAGGTSPPAINQMNQMNRIILRRDAPRTRKTETCSPAGTRRPRRRTGCDRSPCSSEPPTKSNRRYRRRSANHQCCRDSPKQGS